MFHTLSGVHSDMWERLVLHYCKWDSVVLLCTPAGARLIYLFRLFRLFDIFAQRT